MKKIIASLLLLMSCSLSASSTSGYVFPEAGIWLELPKGLEQTWHVSHEKTNMKCDLYQPKDDTRDSRILFVGSIPVEEAPFNSGECPYTVMFDHIRSAIGKKAFHEELNIKCEAVPLYFESNYSLPVRSYRVLIRDLDDGVVLPLDLHSFFCGERLVFLVATVMPCLAEDDLNAFSQAVIDGLLPDSEIESRKEWNCCCEN